MSYFNYFPAIVYSLDNGTSQQLVQDLFRRVTLSEEARNNMVLYEEYHVSDGDSPEIVADRWYNNPELGWVILMTNEILDPRFGWPMTWYQLERHIERKYPSNLYLNANVSVNFNVGESVVQQSNGSSARILAKIGNRLSVINVNGSFTNGANIAGNVSGYYTNLVSSGNVFDNTPEQIAYFAYTGNGTIVDATTYNNSNRQDLEAVTNRENEIRINDRKRLIRILKPDFVTAVVAEFKRQLNQ